MFYSYVTISAAQAHESDDLRHAMSPFSLFLSSLSDAQRILGYVRAPRIVAVHHPKRGKEKATFGEPSEWDSTLFSRLWDQDTAGNNEVRGLNFILEGF